MENLSTGEIVGIIVVLIVFGGLIWNIAKSLFKVLLVAVIILGSIYYIKPEILNEWFGAGTTTKIEQKIESIESEVKPHITEGVEKIENVLDSAENKL